MCGIAGFIESAGVPFSRNNPVEKGRSMLDTIAHRGPDDWGIAAFGYDLPSSAGDPKISLQPARNSKLVLGHRRLSILDVSGAGRQPICERNERVWLTFNGEIYNYLELKKELSDYPFKSGADTEVLIAAYMKWGIDFLERIDGMYAFAIWDTETEML